MAWNPESKTILGRIDIVGRNRPFALSGHVTSFLWKWKSRGQNVIFKIMNYLFLNTNFALKLQENVERWRGNVYSTSQRNYQKFNKI